MPASWIIPKNVNAIWGKPLPPKFQEKVRQSHPDVSQTTFIIADTASQGLKNVKVGNNGKHDANSFTAVRFSEGITKSTLFACGPKRYFADQNSKTQKKNDSVSEKKEDLENDAITSNLPINANSKKIQDSQLNSIEKALNEETDDPFGSIPTTIHVINKLSLPTSSPTFYDLVKSDGFVDKTLFIKEVIEDYSKAILITRPRRCGKTLNMNMLKNYLEIEVDMNGKIKPYKTNPGYF